MQHSGAVGSDTPEALTHRAAMALPCLPALLLLSWGWGLPAGHRSLAPSCPGTREHCFIPSTWLLESIRGVPSRVSASTFTAAMVMSTTEEPINNINVPHTGPFMSPTLFDSLTCKTFYRATQLRVTDGRR